jgi:hypothetical protein
MDPEHCYQDLSIQQKREEERLKKLDPSKAAQIERLGMGFGGGRLANCYVWILKLLVRIQILRSVGTVLWIGIIFFGSGSDF